MEAGRSRLEHGVSARVPKFFKIITAHDADKLRIPDEFMQRYGQNLRKSVLLKVPGKKLWNVTLIESNGETLLENGWQGFWDYHSIAIGNFLLFEYNGTSLFDVLILDLSASEIESHVATFADHEKAISLNVAAERLLPEKEVVDPEADDDSVVFAEMMVSRKKGIDKAKSKNLEKTDREEKKTPIRKKMSDRLNHGDRMGKRLTFGMRSISPREKHDSGTKACLSNIQISGNLERRTSGSDSRKLNREIKDSVETEESDSELDNSASPKCEIVLKDYSRQSLPIDFAEKGCLMSTKSMTLEYLRKQRFWSVLLEKWPYRDPIKLDLTAGWSDFCKENALEIGKTYSLVFNAAKNVIQVQLVDQTEDDVQGKKRRRPEVIQHSSKFKTNCTKVTGTVDKETSVAYRDANTYRNEKAIPHLSFVSFMQPYYIFSSQLAIPVTIARDNFDNMRNDVNLCLSNGKIWPAVCLYQQPNGHLTSGWKTFRDQNELKLGDACVFELDESDRSIWKVTIFRS